MRLTLQTHSDGQRHHAATLELKEGDLAKDMSAAPELKERAMGRCTEITDSVLAGCL